MKRIKVTATHIIDYIPDLASDVYFSEEADTIEKAMEIDSRDVLAGKIGLDELCDSLPYVSYKWEVIDD